ncbi:transcriptional regulator, MarR family [Paraglaciecola sp. T6c]|uniref:MarR family winged helix-turn-helix transcriptional regulator n=1 Tax=Pseudoalteromonas atlantica (strain T6c / ATCC BAA-1087) TaxID=3042615 RepID=UPI00005C5183|nr:MarR family transcriptional regulator [Paraglaciecola sp. T6c]ABG38632.1 transcriptional regulator, MarR family [Paraglaciecola sp. T6c]
MSFENLQLKNQLCHRLYMASNNIARAYREPLLALNLTYPQYVVMMALWEKDGITIAQLIEQTAIDGGAMTQILKKMADKELLNIIKDEQDKRKRVIKLSDSGQALKLKATDVPDKVLCQFAAITPAQSKQLMDLLDLVVAV